MKHAESIAVEGHRLSVALEIPPGGAEVVERGLDLGEGEFHEPARGVVDVHEQRAHGTAVLEPRVLRAVDLDELAETGPPGPRRLAAPQALRPGHPEAHRRHPPAKRFNGEGEAVLLGELLMREGRAEVDASLAHERQRLLAGRGGQLAIAGPPAMAGCQGLGAVAPERAVQAPDLALAQPEQRCRPTPRQAPLRQLGHNLQPIQFPHRQRHRLRHGAIVSAGRTFLLWRNRTFAFGAHRSTSDKVRYVNFWGSDSFSFFWGSRGAMRTTARRLARVLRAR